MPSATKQYVLSTKADLEQEYLSNDWESRLEKATPVRVDSDHEYSAESRWYHRQALTEHYEGDLLVAFTIDYTYHDGSTKRILKMLLINGLRHIIP